MMPETPTQIGPYRVTGLLGRGGSSPVFQAVAPGTGRAVVVRLLSPHLKENAAGAQRFEREARALAASPHPNILQILDTGVDGSRPYLVTELVPEARSLAQVLRERRLDVNEALPVMKGICRGLAHAHQAGVLHHHISPHAILVSPDLSTVKLTEFGFTRVESLGLTGTLSTGAITLGAFNYLAPEQVEGSGAADHRTDLYGVGAVLQEMLTGRPPSGKFTLPSQVNGQLPPETDVIVLKCLARNPAERYVTALELLADLGRLEETRKIRLLSELREIKASSGSRRGLVVAGIVLLLAALVLAGYVLAR
jgi:serine/threonine-protein kinase